MSFYGVKCLRRLEILYCHHMKSSAGIRDLIHDGQFLYRFAKSNPQLQITISMDTGRVPILIASYIPTKPRTPVQEHVIEISEMSKFDVQTQIKRLHQKTGRFVSKGKWKNTETVNFSLQGRWFPGIWNKKISHSALIETHRHQSSLRDYDHLPEKKMFRPEKKTDKARRTVTRRMKKLKLN